MVEGGTLEFVGGLRDRRRSYSEISFYFAAGVLRWRSRHKTTSIRYLRKLIVILTIARCDKKRCPTRRRCVEKLRFCFKKGIVVAQGVVPVLVRLLDSSSTSEIKEKIVTAIARFSTVDSSKHVLIAEGFLLLHHLLRILDAGSGFAKEKACIALQALSHSKENTRAIGSSGGISSLLEICLTFPNGVRRTGSWSGGLVVMMLTFVWIWIEQIYIEQQEQMVA